MSKLRSLALSASVLSIAALAVPASAAEVKLSCPGATAITYQPHMAKGEMLSNLNPIVIGAVCIAGSADQHLLKIGDADPVILETQEKVQKFLVALGRFIDDQAKKKIAFK